MADEILAHLEAAGYRAEETGHATRWELASGTSVLWVVVWPKTIQVHAFRPEDAPRWTARFDRTAPEAAVVAFLQAIEEEMSRG